MSTTLVVPGVSGGLVLKQEELKNETIVKKYTQLFDQNKIGIEYWLQLALMYYRNGQVDQYQSILTEALKDEGVDLNGSNEHMFENKKARHDAINSLASHYYQMYEQELQKVPGSDIND